MSGLRQFLSPGSTWCCPRTKRVAVLTRDANAQDGQAGPARRQAACIRIVGNLIAPQHVGGKGVQVSDDMEHHHPAEQGRVKGLVPARQAAGELVVSEDG